MAIRRTTLRLRVLAGVAATTIAALAAFDVAAVATMRGYLLGTTSDNLQRVLTVTEPRVNALVAATAYAHTSGHAVIWPVVSEYSVVYQPSHGAQVILAYGPASLSAAAVPASLVRPTPMPVTRKTRFGSYTTVAYSFGSLVAARPAPGGVLLAGTSLDQVHKTLDRVILIVTLGSVAAVALIGLGVFAILRRGMRPIESMAAQADRITAGDLTDRVEPSHGGTEVGRLGTALNGMLERIETFVAERQADQELMRRFFADASHELRTPLASLRANAELYSQGALTRKPDVDEVMRRISLETQRMSQLVDDMLRLARLGQHPGQQHEPVDVTALVEESAASARAAEPGRVLRLDIPENLVVDGDEELLRRAVDNLLANVRTHTPADATATVTVAGHDGMVTIDVADDGPGVPARELPRIFDRFYRGSAPVRRPGSGLGLAIVSGIATAHGGSVGAEPNSPRGLRVRLSLPEAPISQPNDQVFHLAGHMPEASENGLTRK